MNRREKIERASDYALYYGVGRAGELSGFDIAIVEPAGQTNESVRDMQQAGSLVLAYLSFMEIADYAEEFKILDKKDFLKDKNGILRNEEYSTYLLDIRSKKWQKLMLQKVNKLFLEGYDGLFLDTIGDIEAGFLNQQTREELIQAAVDILKEIRADYPEHILIQNNGLENLCDSTARLIDGICWENPPVNKKECADWIEAITDRLQMLQSLFHLKVFILCEGNPMIDAAKEKKEAEDRGFLFYEAVKGYVGGVKRQSE